MYINDSKNYEDLVKAFYYHETPDPNFPTKDEVLYCNLEYFDYGSSLYFLFRKGEKLYEWAGGHCSYNGYEEFVGDFDNLSSLEVTPQAILMRPSLDPDLRDVVLSLLPS